VAQRCPIAFILASLALVASVCKSARSWALQKHLATLSSYVEVAFECLQGLTSDDAVQNGFEYRVKHLTAQAIFFVIWENFLDKGEEDIRAKCVMQLACAAWAAPRAVSTD
jgi:hypothetical protein